MSDSSNQRGPVRLRPGLQRYAWGDASFLQALLGVPATGEPLAEAWFGDHPMAPATAVTDDGEEPLDRWVAAAGPAVLGPGATGERLPYLLKLIAAARPLSVQVHPNEAQAAEGFARERAAGLAPDDPSCCYRDPNAKFELLVALERFDVLCGFRPLEAIRDELARLPELSGLLPTFEPTPAGLAALLGAWFALPDADVAPALRRLVERLAAEDAAGRLDDRSPGRWALSAHRRLSGDGPPDRGLLLVFLLAHRRLEPGQALFLPAGVPHTYLEGAGVELMGSSDNVLRAGLTRKHVDPGELLRVVRFEAGAPPVLDPIVDESGLEGTYAVPSPELDLRRMALSPGSPAARTARGAETLLALPAEGARVTVAWAGGRLELGRGEACLVPHGTRYDLMTNGPATVFRATSPEGAPPRAFRGRTPTPLAFGTSGLRGRVEDLTDLEAYVDTRGFLDFVVSTSDALPGTPVAIGGDLRPSTHSADRSIVQAVTRAVLDAGFRPVWCGQLPTPALACFAFGRGWPSVMVTGSHIPFDRNGIKFNKASGEVLKADEAPILAAIARVRRREYVRARADSPFDDDGFLRPGERPRLGEPTGEAVEAYRRRILDAFPADALAGLRLVLYEHSAVGRELVADVLRALGAEVIPTGRSETFVAIDTEAIAADRLAELQRLHDAVRATSGPIDAIVSTDGDSDRPMLLGVDDAGRVRFVGGDVLGAVVADFLGADAIAVPVSANDLIDRHFEPRGVPVRRTRIGSPWVIDAMNGMAGERRVGWEANGGFLTATPIPIEGGGTLGPLPTRDAVLPIVAALTAARRADRSLVAHVAELPARAGRAGLLDEVPTETSRALLARFGPEAPDLHAALAAHFTPERGFGAIEAVDHTDGVRIRFAGGDVAHVRPSGNAPQLRIYATADTEDRAEAIVELALAEPDGVLRGLCREAHEGRFVAAVRRNVEAIDALFTAGTPAGVIGTVSGSAGAQAFWQRQLDLARPSFRAREARSFHEDLPVNQAFGLLLLWQRLREGFRPGEGALVAFVFGEGSRATPFTEAESGQKPALASFVAADGPGGGRRLSVVELAMRAFAPVEAYLRRSGFDGLVVKWGDEVQIPTLDLTGTDPRFAGADVVRFVSIRAMTDDDARNKDWVGVDGQGRVTAFIPRRPLAEMEALAERGLLQRRDGELWGGVNLGSIAVSRALLDALLEEFSAEVNDPDADRRKRPDLDPQLFTALTIAALPNPVARQTEWETALAESAAMRKLDANLPDVLHRLRRVLDAFESRHHRRVAMAAMDFGDQYWGDVGQHRQMFDWYAALRDEGATGRVSRALAGLPEATDAHGNRIAGHTVLGDGVVVRGSVLVDARIDEGEIVDSVLVGTRAGRVRAEGAFDVESTVAALALAPRAGTYTVVSTAPVNVGAGERRTTVFLPDGAVALRVHEDADLRDRAATYDAPILGNPLSFAEAHRRAVAADPGATEAAREAARGEVLRALGEPQPDR